MELIAIEPLRVAMPEGPKDLEPGDRLSLPDRVGKRLLQLAPGKVRVVDDLPFSPGETVSYRIPVIEGGPSQYTWSEHRGVVQAVDSRWETITVIPTDEAQPWRIVAWCYARRDEP